MSRLVSSVYVIALLVMLGGLSACIDTALGLVVGVEGGQVQITGETIAVDVMCLVRVGEHALAGDNFTLPMAGIFVGDSPIAEVHLERPIGFVGRLEPGESVMINVHGEVSTAGFPNARALLCGETQATALVQWVAEAQPDDPLDPPERSAGSASGLVSVVCD